MHDNDLPLSHGLDLEVRAAGAPYGPRPIYARGSELRGTTTPAYGRPSRSRVPSRRSRSTELDRDPVAEPRSIDDSSRGRSNPWDLSEVRTFGRPEEEVGAEFRARAESAIEKMQGASDNIRDGALHVLDKADNPAALARQILHTSSPEYLRGWSKMAMGQQHRMTAEEQRAMSLTDANGGYLVPFQLDPTVIITSDGSVNDIRKAARTVVATGDVWNGVSSGAVSWSWDAEGAEVSDDATTFGQPTIPIHKAQGFVPITIEAFEDAANVTAEVGRLLAFGKDTLEAGAFAVGTGSGQPTGIVTALDGTASEIAVATPETFALADVYALDSALPSRYQAMASWLANRKLYNLVRQFDTNGGAGLWERIGNGQPANLLGRPALEAEAMDATWNAAASADNFLAVYGDFANYVIADRVGTRVEFVPTLFHTGNNRPSGQRGWHAWYRVGADSVNDGAFRMLNLATTA
jgi:HK97 family phage major capsid protein